MDIKKIISLSEQFSKKAQKNFGAGILFLCPKDKTILLLQRSEKISNPGHWGLPGGHAEDNESPSETAIRETKEELGFFPINVKITNIIKNKSYYILIIKLSLKEKYILSSKIKLNYENSKYKWFKINNLPKNLHFPIKGLLT